jgi:hypothetical protein
MFIMLLVVIDVAKVQTISVTTKYFVLKSVKM